VRPCREATHQQEDQDYQQDQAHEQTLSESGMKERSPRPSRQPPMQGNRPAGRAPPRQGRRSRPNRGQREVAQRGLGDANQCNQFASTATGTGRPGTRTKLTVAAYIRCRKARCGGRPFLSPAEAGASAGGSPESSFRAGRGARP
jgi:hypothetical protein